MNLPTPTLESTGCWPHRFFARLRLGFGITFGAIALLAQIGCESVAPSSHRSTPRAASLAPPPESVAVAPLDVELAQLTASGAVEPHVEWTAQARIQLADALSRRTGFTVHPVVLTPNLEMERELQEVAALVRRININELNARFGEPSVGPVPPDAQGRPLDYDTGALRAHLEHLEEGAVLFIHLRDSYATGGRKALAALSLVGAALTGVYVQPSMGSTLATATLVDHNGRVLWINQSVTPLDLRTPEGIERLLDELLAGLPTAPPSDGVATPTATAESPEEP